MNEHPPLLPVRLALVFYTPMILSGFFSKPASLLLMERPATVLTGLALALGLGLVVVLASRWVSRQTRWGKSLRDEIRAMLGALSSREILLLALFSAFGEEILFRGVIQPWLGLWATSLLFGLLHFPYRRSLIPWSFFALVLGVVLGWMTLYYESLWPAITLHFLINHFNLHDLITDLEGDREGKRETSD